MQTKREPDISSKFDAADSLFIDQYLLFFHLMIRWQSHFLMTTVASTSMLATCMSFPVVVLVMRTFHIRIILKCFIDKSFYCFIRISGNSAKKLNACCR